MKNLLNREPATLIGLVLTVAVAVIDHFAHLTDGQWQHLLDAAPLVSGLVIRSQVSPATGDKVQFVLDALAEAEQEASTAQKRLADLRSAIGPATTTPVTAPPVAPPAA